MRLFIAVDFPEKVRDEILNSTKSLRKQFPEVAWTKKENIHLTIKFLGNINSKLKDDKENELLEKIKQGIEKSSVGIEPFELVFEKLGFFDREQLIIWLGAKANPQLSLLIERLDKEMEKLGFAKERRLFTPHITIGRGKHLEQKVLQRIEQVMNTEQFVLPEAFTVSAIHLMNSTLTSKGPIYTELTKFALS